MNIMKGGAVLDLEPGDRQFKLQAVPARRPDTGIGLLACWLAGWHVHDWFSALHSTADFLPSATVAPTRALNRDNLYQVPAF
jgi:hypothetical protein